MNIRKLIDALQDIADSNAEEIGVAVAGWDDNFYEGKKVEGIRLVKENDFEKNEIKAILFIIVDP